MTLAIRRVRRHKARDIAMDEKLALIGAQADYPPNEQATDEVHLTRAVMLQFAADAALPAGVPLEIRLSPCHPTR